jgi:hypothetical protein
MRTMAMGALDFYGDCHNFIVFLCAPVVIISLSYFVDHHPSCVPFNDIPVFLICFAGKPQLTAVPITSRKKSFNALNDTQYGPFRYAAVAMSPAENKPLQTSFGVGSTCSVWQQEQVYP